MDTRNKILKWTQAVELFRERAPDAAPWAIVSGYFDPLLADHGRRLREIAGPGGKVLVLLTSPERPILPVRARAELVAGLGIVEYVVLPPEGGSDASGIFPAVDIRREETADARRRQELIRHVHDRQAG